MRAHSNFKQENSVGNMWKHLYSLDFAANNNKNLTSSAARRQRKNLDFLLHFQLTHVGVMHVHMSRWKLKYDGIFTRNENNGICDAMGKHYIKKSRNFPHAFSSSHLSFRSLLHILSRQSGLLKAVHRTQSMAIVTLSRLPGSI